MNEFFFSFSPFVYGPQYFDMKVGPQNNDRLFFSRAVVVVYFLPRWEFFFEGGASWGVDGWTISICISPITPADSSPSSLQLRCHIPGI